MIPDFAVVSCICLVAFMLVKFCRMFAVMKFFPPSNSLVQKTLTSCERVMPTKNHLRFRFEGSWCDKSAQVKCFWFCDFCAGQWNQGGEETTTQVTIPKDVRIWFRRFYFIVCNFFVILLIR